MIMIEFINKYTGTVMYVDESRKDEYIAAGHEPAVNCIVAKPRSATKPKKTARKK